MNTKTVLIVAAVVVVLFIVSKKQNTNAGDYREMSLLEVQIFNVSRLASGLPVLSLSYPWEINAQGNVRQRLTM